VRKSRSTRKPTNPHTAAAITASATLTTYTTATSLTSQGCGEMTSSGQCLGRPLSHSLRHVPGSLHRRLTPESQNQPYQPGLVAVPHPYPQSTALQLGQLLTRVVLGDPSRVRLQHQFGRRVLRPLGEHPLRKVLRNRGLGRGRPFVQHRQRVDPIQPEQPHRLRLATPRL